MKLKKTTLKTVELAATDSTGMEVHHCSRYFTKRRKKSGEPVIYKRFLKLSALIDIRSHLVFSILTEQNLKVDIQSLCPLLDACVSSVRVDHLLADAGYDSEENHRYARQKHGIITTLPPRTGRPTDKPPKGRYRRLVTQGFEHRPYVWPTLASGNSI